MVEATYEATKIPNSVGEIGTINNLANFFSYTHIPKELATGCTGALGWRIDPITFAIICDSGSGVQYHGE